MGCGEKAEGGWAEGKEEACWGREDGGTGGALLFQIQFLMEGFCLYTEAFSPHQQNSWCRNKELHSSLMLGKGMKVACPQDAIGYNRAYF